jgi:hypothetical protein
VRLHFKPPLAPIREENLYVWGIFEVALERWNTFLTGLRDVADDRRRQLKKPKKSAFELGLPGHRLLFLSDGK